MTCSVSPLFNGFKCRHIKWMDSSITHSFLCLILMPKNVYGRLSLAYLRCSTCVYLSNISVAAANTRLLLTLAMYIHKYADILCSPSCVPIELNNMICLLKLYIQVRDLFKPIRRVAYIYCTKEEGSIVSWHSRAFCFLSANISCVSYYFCQKQNLTQGFCHSLAEMSLLINSILLF